MESISNKYVKAGFCLLFAILAVTLIQSTTNAQLSHLKNGDTVKVLAPDVHPELLEGTIYDVTSTDLYLNSGPYSFVISLDSIEELQMRTGQKRHTLEGAFIGLIGGGVLGGVLTKPNSNECDEADTNYCGWSLDFVNAGITGAGVIAGAVLGTLIGAVGGTFIKSKSWEKVPIEFSLNTPLRRSNNLSLGLSVSASF